MSTPLQALLIGSAALFALSGCNPAGEQMAADRVEAPTPPAPDAHDMDTLPVAFRVAFMSGHVEAGLALYRAGAPEQAAKHLLHPVSETHAAERAGIDALGFAFVPAFRVPLSEHRGDAGVTREERRGFLENRDPTLQIAL